MTIMMSELASSGAQDALSAHPVTLLATSNGTQIAVQVGIILLSLSLLRTYRISIYI